MGYTIYEMCYDKQELPECSIECVPYDSNFFNEYKRIKDECFPLMGKLKDLFPERDFSDIKIPEDTSNIFCFKVNEEIIGSVTCVGNEIFDLWVRPSDQGKGHGRELLIWAMHHIREQNGEPIKLHVSGFNSVALKLYESVGFSICDSIGFGV